LVEEGCDGRASPEKKGGFPAEKVILPNGENLSEKGVAIDECAAGGKAVPKPHRNDGKSPSSGTGESAQRRCFFFGTMFALVFPQPECRASVARSWQGEEL
jgi:hypothetical protein